MSADTSLRLVAFLACVFAVGSLRGQSPDIDLVELTTGLDASTIGLARPGDGSGNLFTVAKNGLIQIWDGTQIVGTPFADLGAVTDPAGEQGLLGLAFHPNFETNRRFYVNYIDNMTGNTVVARYQAAPTTATNPNVVDSSVAPVQVLEIVQPATNHNGGDMHFGPDGYLYIASGDGGADWCSAQDTTSLLGKILRIDVDVDDFPGDSDKNYGIPAGNPLGNEVWVLGARNPWRFSFDRENGDLWIGDVGEGAWEEFDLIPTGTTAPTNLGWPWFEGEDSFSTCAVPEGSFSTCDSAPFTCPVLTLNRIADGACSAIGGYRYRGSEFPSLRGLYFYTDWCEGWLHAARETAPAWTTYQRLYNLFGFGPTGMGEDDDGELYVVNGSALYQVTGTFDLVFGDGFESGTASAWQ